MTAASTIERFIKIAEEKGGKCLSTIHVNDDTKLKFQCGCSHIWESRPSHIVAGRWCPKCGHQNGRKYTVDDDFFSRDTEESFYVAGFWAADGWKTRKSGGGFSIGLQLCHADLEHLLKIKNVLKCTSPHKFKASKRRGTPTFSNTFIFNSEKAYKDLERFGVVENKTYVYDMPEWLREHALVRHFIRGYIDGDGCFYEGNNKKQGPHIAFSIKGTYMCLNNIMSIFIQNGVIDEIDRREMKPREGKKYPAFDTLQCGGNAVISRMHDYLYNDATIFLTRKKELSAKAKEFMVYGTDKQRKSREGVLPITKDILLCMAQQYKNTTKIAEFFGCTAANISWWIKHYDIKSEMDKARGVLDPQEVFDKYKELGKKSAVAEFFGVTKSRVGQIVKKFEVNVCE